MMTQSWNHLKILTYNPLSVRYHLPLLRQKGYITCDDATVEQYFYPKSFIGPWMHWIYDRTKHVPHFLPIKEDVSPMPSYDPNFKMTFEEVLLKRAEDLLNMGKLINIHWSGGLDSTTMYCALFEKATDPSQIRVVCSHDSIVESGGFFDRFIKHTGVEYIIADRTSREIFFQRHQFDVDKEIFADGAPADQVYGKQLFYAPHWMPDRLDDPWEDAIQYAVGQDTIDFLMPAIRATDIPLKTYREFLWWYKMNFSWYCHRALFLLGMPAKYIPISLKFYDSPEIQRWAMMNAPAIIEQLPDKMPQRQFIYQRTGYSEYAFMKQRYRSSAATNYISYMFMLEDGRSIFTQDIANGDNYVAS